MKRVTLTVLLAAACVATLIVIHPHWFVHLTGVDTQQSWAYDFWSGVGPCLISALGMSTLITGLWHGLNCHKPGCLRIGRHKVAGSPWCNRHQGEAREDPDPVAERLDRIIELLEHRDNGPCDAP